MERVKKIATVSDMVEAQMLESMLKEQGIPHVLKSYHDAAYDGLFQHQKGWGHIEAPEAYETEIMELINGLQTRKDPDSETDTP